MIETNCLYDYKLNEKGVNEVRTAKEIFSEMQQLVLGRLKPSRETSLVRTKLEEASMYMTRAIAQDESNHTEINTY
jgi:hypothetical protein